MYANKAIKIKNHHIDAASSRFNSPLISYWFGCPNSQPKKNIYKWNKKSFKT